MFVDHYHMLGLERTATPEQIKTAYRELAFQFHPDTNKTPTAHERFLEIGEAYRVLSDLMEKAKYDRLHDRHHGRSASGQNPNTSYERLERTRAKRASRYNRSMYSQRMRYRGTSVPKQEQNRKRQQQEAEFRQKTYEQNKARAEAAVEAAEQQQKGYIGLAKVLQSLTLIMLVFCSWLLLDRYLADWGAEEVVTGSYEVPWSFTQPGVVKIRTSGSQFGVIRTQAKYLPEGIRVRVKKSRWTNIPTEAYVRRYEMRSKYFRTFGGRYDSPFGFIWLVVVMCIATLAFRRNPETNVYIGVATLFVAANFIGIIFWG